MSAAHDFDEQMMRRAIRLAMNGRGRVEPNPMVGAVIAKGDRVIGEGFHAQFGGPHAEPAALASATESPQGATAYVTLEPCCHTNKKTPPCVPALIGAGIARVVCGCVDPNPDVNGKGLDQLRAAGVSVDVNVLEDPAKQLLAPFIARTVYDRPYVTLKWAETADGKVAGLGGKRLQISNEQSSAIVHTLRARSDAIVVGVNTVIADDPLLTARAGSGSANSSGGSVLGEAGDGAGTGAPPVASVFASAPSPSPSSAPPPRRLFRVVLDSRLRLPMS